MTPLDLVRLTPLMDRTSGRPDVIIGLIDGPVVVGHPQPSRTSAGSTRTGAVYGRAVRSFARHLRRGNSVGAAGIGRSGICPGCTVLVRSIFAETVATNGDMPSAKPEESPRLCSSASMQARESYVSAARASLDQKRACIRRGSVCGGTAGRDHDCGRRERRNGGEHCHYAAPLGDTGGGIRLERQAHE